MNMKEAYLEKVMGQLSEWRAWIDRYRQIKRVKGSERSEDEMLTQLESCYQSARDRMESLRGSNEGAWATAKDALEQSLVELKRALDESGAGQASYNPPLHTGRSPVFPPFSRKE